MRPNTIWLKLTNGISLFGYLMKVGYHGRCSNLMYGPNLLVKSPPWMGIVKVRPHLLFVNLYLVDSLFLVHDNFQVMATFKNVSFCFDSFIVIYCPCINCLLKLFYTFVWEELWNGISLGKIVLLYTRPKIS